MERSNPYLTGKGVGLIILIAQKFYRAKIK
jgi:hypothetical protein